MSGARVAAPGAGQLDGGFGKPGLRDRSFGRRRIPPIDEDRSHGRGCAGIPARARSDRNRAVGARRGRPVEVALGPMIEWKALLESGQDADQTEIARRGGINRARVTRVMGMLRLAPEIKEHILPMPGTTGRPPITEHMLHTIISGDA